MSCLAVFRRTLTPATLAVAFVAAASPAKAGLTFNFTFDASLAADFGANAALLESDVVAVGNMFSSLFTNNVQLNIAVMVDPSVSLAASLSNYNSTFTYSAVRQALAGQASTPQAQAAIQALPFSEPTPNKSAGNSNSFAVSTAQEKALHLLSGTATGSDGTFYVGTNSAWSFSGTVGSNQYSFMNAAEHEISELMGRSTQLNNAAFNYNTPIDLFRCTATGPNGSGVINMDPGATNVYFSTDGCATVAKYYNGPNSAGADLQDWAASSTADPFDAFLTPGVSASLSAADVQIMNVLGWQSSIPEPLTLLVLLPGALGLVGLRGRRDRLAG